MVGCDNDHNQNKNPVPPSTRKLRSHDTLGRVELDVITSNVLSLGGHKKPKGKGKGKVKSNKMVTDEDTQSLKAPSPVPPESEEENSVNPSDVTQNLTLQVFKSGTGVEVDKRGYSGGQRLTPATSESSVSILNKADQQLTRSNEQDSVTNIMPDSTFNSSEHFNFGEVETLFQVSWS
jgi:hypothetical protein